MSLNIPNVASPGESLISGMNAGENLADMMMRKHLLPYQQQLMQAQAAKSGMLAKLMDQVMNGQGGINGNINSGNLLSGLLGIPIQSQVIDGKLVQTNPFTGTQQEQIGETPQQKSQREALQQASGQTLKSTAENSLAGMGVNASFDAIDQLMKDPNYSHLAGTLKGKLINSQPIGLPLGSWLQSSFPNDFTSDEANLAGQANAHLGNIISGVAAKFKGPFKSMVNNIINNMKPNIGDSLPVQRGKIAALKQLSDLADRQNAEISDLVSQGMNPAMAALKVAKEMPIDVSKYSSNNSQNASNSISNNEKNISTPWPENKNATNENKLEGKQPPTGSIWMIRPDGLKVSVHLSNVPYAKSLNYREVS